MWEKPLVQIQNKKSGKFYNKIKLKISNGNKASTKDDNKINNRIFYFQRS